MSICWLAVIVTGVVGQAPDLPPVVRQYSRSATYYYKSPDPRLGSRMLKELLKKENLEHAFFQKNPLVLTLIAAQLGDIATGKPKIVREYEAAFAGAPMAGRRVILRALMNCGDGETRKKVTAWLADRRNVDLRTDLKTLDEHLGNPKRKHARDQAARAPRDIDLLWANFFVTGEYAPVSRILDVFDLPDASKNAALKRVARWSLGSNLKQHPRLVEIVRVYAKERPAGSRKVIDELTRALPKDRSR